ncbi:MAG: MarR family winged helix-turn-helix transcriptional regulator [Pigmentiphaga sp.]|uniref:MarR family winged helix-turn-helix transcriptional regulator n=1 Tax=Pigmentiphaga sp. TaxID=1977564 RepID=UPI0029AD5C75|nr:MarR family winged helix-turn-helix transcriptional regulator [Pigmentiphaga sp.]MDX3906261.1 MarR family winged helix-turn-helix transcriptional regulator [Pigmentiphaga sp.]
MLADPPKPRTDDVPAEPDPLLVLYSMPGHLIRRAKQKTTLAFAPIARRFNLTPIQYVVLKAVAIRPGVDQAELGDIVGLDTSTTGQVVARLEQRGLIGRRADGRRQRVEIQPEGLSMLEALQPALSDIQEEITHPLTAKEKQQFLRLLSKMLGIANLYHQPRARRRPRTPGR